VHQGFTPRILILKQERRLAMEHARHSKDELEAKLREIYPEIGRHELELSLEFSHEKNAWIIHLKKGEHRLSTHLEKKDADECLEGVECVYLGVQVGQFVKNFEEDDG
jgi:hypothetical protein